MSKQPFEYLTKCRVPNCGKEFASDPFDVPIVGAPQERIVKFVTALMGHVQKKHPEQMEQISGAIQQYMGYMIVAVFEVADPKLLEMQEAIRHALHKFTQRVVITDEQIAARVRSLGLPPEVEEGIDTLIRDMRDLLTESGRYAPTQQTEKPLVVV